MTRRAWRGPSSSSTTSKVGLVGGDWAGGGLAIGSKSRSGVVVIMFLAETSHDEPMQSVHARPDARSSQPNCGDSQQRLWLSEARVTIQGLGTRKKFSEACRNLTKESGQPCPQKFPPTIQARGRER